MGTQLSPKEYSPQFSAHVSCGQTARWIKMPLGMEAGDFVLDGDQLVPLKGGTTPICGQCVLWPNGWMDQDATGMEVDLGLGDFVLNGDLLLQKEHTPNFRPVSIVAKRLDGLRCHLVWR